MSSPPNPPFDPELLPPLPPPPPRHGENPPWTGWDVLLIIVLTVASVFILLLLTTFFAQRVLYPKIALLDVAQYPLVSVAAQLIAYVVVFAFMVYVVKHRGQPFWRSVRWNWPVNWMGYLLGGVVLSLALQLLAHWLPMPKELPMDRFFQTTRQAWVLAIFGTTAAPLLEELFFRGFLYPVLTRRLGVVLSIFVTALAFSLIHAQQLGRAWGPLLVIFLVGLALTITRAVTKSVAAGVLIHVAYNGTISALLFAATGGFRHLDRMNQ